jgi:predicted nuclease of predicted toxin-antitoxin system
MRILIDECVPKRLARQFLDHEAVTVAEAGWSGKKNGELLKLMVTSGYEIFVTLDQNLQYQQNLQDANIAVIILAAASSRYDDLLPLIPSTLKVLALAVSGKIYIIDK